MLETIGSRIVMVCLAFSATALGAEKKQAILDPAKGGPDYAIQGEYTGRVTGAEPKLGVQVVALGDGKFRAVLRRGGLPGDGWDMTRGGDGEGALQDGAVKFELDGGKCRATIRDGAMNVTDASGKSIGRLERVVRKSPTLGKKPPAGAIVLFDGTNADAFKGGRLSPDKLLMQGTATKRTFKSCKLHLEFRTPFMPYARGQGRGNSGCYLQSRYEVQILDSFGEREAMGDCGGIYSITDQILNMCFPPLSWQTYDIDYTAPNYDAKGNKLANAIITVHHNGVLIAEKIELTHATTAAPLSEGPDATPIYFQDHGNPVRFRNIWVIPKPDDASPPPSAPKIKVTIIGGQNNHNWRKSTPFMKQLLDKAGHFETTVYNTPDNKGSKDQWDAWQPEFTDFDCVVLDYNGQMWPEPVKKDFEDYVRNGGGAVVIHAANNSFTGWTEYEKMVGLLWRGSNYGYSLYLDTRGEVVREDPGQGRGMGHGSHQYDWKMTTRDANHPISRGMPVHWMHKHDELYHGQRGPAENVNILLTAYSDPGDGRGGTGKHEPIVWWVPYGKGKVVTNVMGHVGELNCMKCVGFKTILYRACEWVATSKRFTQIPPNFPTPTEARIEE